MSTARADAGAASTVQERPAPDPADAVTFAGRSFCVTGRFTALRRTQVEREIRERGGTTTDYVSGVLDYLVVGGASSTGWKFGGFGAKLEKARRLREKGATLVILDEEAFRAALDATPPLGLSDAKAKVVSVTYTFTVGDEDDVDMAAVERTIAGWQSRPGAFASLTVHESTTVPARDLFSAVHGTGRYRVVECKLAQQVPPYYPGQRVADEVAMAFEQVRGVDGRLLWRERLEGSEEYDRLLHEIPAWSRLRAS